MRSLIFGLTFLGLGLASCKTLRPENAELSSLPLNCQDPVPIQAYLKADTSCTADAFFKSEAAARMRDLSPWIPCNDVEWINTTQDLFGPAVGNDADTLALSTYARTAQGWLNQADRFTGDMVSKVFQNPDEGLTFNQNNPILDSALARALKELIRSAQANIVMDVQGLQGSWGAEVLHDLAAAAQRGVEVVILRESLSDPLWQATRQFSLKHPAFVALDANLKTGARAPLLPPRFNEIRAAMTAVGTGAPADRSKILIVDGLYQKSPDEYQTLKPRALVMSRNISDSEGSFDHDEAVIIRGPAAVIALLHYQPDLQAAWEQGRRTQKLNAADDSLLQSVLGRLERIRSTPTEVKGQGWVSVQPIQIRMHDEIRNLDSSIIPRILAAERSIDLYGRTAFNWPLAMALKEAMVRGVKVRILLNQPTAMEALANATLPYMLIQAPRRTANGQEKLEFSDTVGAVTREGDLPVKWFLPMRNKARNLVQELHAGTLIIDGRLALFGSAGFDSLSWSLSSREYSVWIDDPALASESARQFDRLWNHPLLTVSHKVWLGEEAPAPELLQYARARGTDADLQAGRSLSGKAPTVEQIKSILAEASDASGLLIPAKVLQNEQGGLQCRRL